MATTELQSHLPTPITVQGLSNGKNVIATINTMESHTIKIHSRGFGKSLPRRDFLSDRHQCTRIKRGYGPIRVRIVLKEQSQMANMDPSVIVLRIKRHQKNAKRDAAGRNKVASNIQHELVLANMSSEVSQLASRTVALKKAEKANQIISRFETSKTASMIKDIH